LLVAAVIPAEEGEEVVVGVGVEEAGVAGVAAAATEPRRELTMA
jgi:hypothetical protein